MISAGKMHCREPITIFSSSLRCRAFFEIISGGNNRAELVGNSSRLKRKTNQGRRVRIPAGQGNQTQAVTRCTFTSTTKYNDYENNCQPINRLFASHGWSRV